MVNVVTVNLNRHDFHIPKGDAYFSHGSEGDIPDTLGAVYIPCHLDLE